MKRFDVATYGGVVFVIIESDLLPADDAIVTIPLFADYPAMKHLNPIIDFAGTPLCLGDPIDCSASTERTDAHRVR